MPSSDHAPVLVFGASSLVGSHFAAHSRRPVLAAGRGEPGDVGVSVARFFRVDVLESGAARSLIRSERPTAVVNYAAFTGVDAAEEIHRAGRSSQEDPVWGLNVTAAESIASECRSVGARLVHISTDFVFDGTSGPYRESDPIAGSPDEVGWYGWTKAEGERRVRESDPGACILRISYPFRAGFEPKLDFARGILNRQAQGRLPPLFSDQQITPTWIPDVTRAVEHVLDHPIGGAVHCASPTSTTPLEFGSEIIRRAGVAGPPVQKGSLREFLLAPQATRRPVRGGLRCDALAAAGVPLTDWRTAIQLLLESREAQSPSRL